MNPHCGFHRHERETEWMVEVNIWDISESCEKQFLKFSAYRIKVLSCSLITGDCKKQALFIIPWLQQKLTWAIMFRRLRSITWSTPRWKPTLFLLLIVLVGFDFIDPSMVFPANLLLKVILLITIPPQADFKRFYSSGLTFIRPLCKSRVLRDYGSMLDIGFEAINKVSEASVREKNHIYQIPGVVIS